MRDKVISSSSYAFERIKHQNQEKTRTNENLNWKKWRADASSHLKKIRAQIASFPFVRRQIIRPIALPSLSFAKFFFSLSLITLVVRLAYLLAQPMLTYISSILAERSTMLLGTYNVRLFTGTRNGDTTYAYIHALSFFFPSPSTSRSRLPIDLSTTFFVSTIRVPKLRIQRYDEF